MDPRRGEDPRSDRWQVDDLDDRDHVTSFLGSKKNMIKAYQDRQEIINIISSDVIKIGKIISPIIPDQGLVLLARLARSFRKGVDDYSWRHQ